MNSTTEKPIKLIAIYARVSTSTQEEQQTIQNQLTALREFADKNSYIVVREYVDNGWSGDVLARPGLDTLRQDIKGKIWEAVLIYDPDRLARRYSYQELVMDELRDAGVEIIFITVPTPKNSEDKILHGVRGLFAEYERTKIAERFRLGKLRKVKEGHVLTTEAPYGYTYIKKKEKEHGYYEINPDEARVIKMIFSWVTDEGMTLRAVVRRLQKMGIKPRKSKRGVWNTSTLSTLLRHRVYIGETHWGSSYAVVPEKPLKNDKYQKTKKTSRRKRPQEEWIMIPVPPIIDRKIFERAGQQLKTNFALCQRNKKNEYLLSNKIECTCGRKRAGEGYFNKPNLYYRCSDRVLSFPLPPKCEEKGINARLADELVWQKITQLMSSEKLLSEQASRWFGNRQKRAESDLADVEGLKKEIEKIKGQVERYNKGYGAGVFNLEQLKQYTTPLVEKIGQTETLIAKATSEANQTQLEAPSRQEIGAFAESARATLQDLKFPAKRAIILNVVDKVVGNRDHLKIIGHIPVNQYAKYKFYNRHCRSA